MNENEEIKNIICEACGREANDFVPCSEICPVCIRINKALIDLGYHKTEFKTNSDKLRNTSDEELAKTCITSHWDYYNDSGMLYQSTLVEGTYTTFDGAYEANLKWLKQKYKGE